jgi:hypothetical protein
MDTSIFDNRFAFAFRTFHPSILLTTTSFYHYQKKKCF